MIPGVYEFRWDAAHMIFLGAFYTVACVLAVTLALSLRRCLRLLEAGEADEILWHEEFHDLPASHRSCRHEMAGRIRDRVCPNAFDCRHCPDYERFSAMPCRGAATGHLGAHPHHPREGGDPESRQTASAVPWFDMPADRLYHRGHTWVKRAEDGNVLIGLDDLASRLLGPPESVELPKAGTKLQVNGTAWRMKGSGAEVRVLSPVDGVVVEAGSPQAGWYLKVRPEAGRFNDRHLLRGEEILPWVLREVERLQATLTAGGPANLADGGLPVADLHRIIPPDRRDEVLGDVFLEP
jgi:glycine cleavage system H lipoate-binding protein